MLPADDMSDDGNHCTDQFELVAALLKKQGYSTHALGKVRSACRLHRRLRLVDSRAADTRAPPGCAVGCRLHLLVLHADALRLRHLPGLLQRLHQRLLVPLEPGPVRRPWPLHRVRSNPLPCPPPQPDTAQPLLPVQLHQQHASRLPEGHRALGIAKKIFVQEIQDFVKT